MFAAATTDTLSISDPAALKKTPSSIPSCLDLIHPPTDSSWSPDNACLYISSQHIIHRYEPTSNTLKDIYVHDFKPVSNLVAKDKSTLIFSSEEKIHILECDASLRILQTFETQKTSVSSLSLSNDNSLLSSTTAWSVHIHNLSLGSHTVLRGLPSQPIATAAFHPHSRTRLLVAAGKQIAIYDTTKPSGPSKTIAINESASGDIIAIACSPFSKTLVAVATASGFLGLIDLEKEKALFRTLNLKTPLTTLAFSPEGAVIYAGTEKGRLLLIDLRALDKPAKPIILSESGSRIQTISIQKKLKSNADGAVKAPASSTTATRKPSTEAVPSVRRTVGSTLAGKSSAKAAPSPARPRAITVGAASPPARRVNSKAPASATTPVKRPLNRENKVLSPTRDPLGNSGVNKGLADELNALANRRRGKAPTSPSQVQKVPLETTSSRTRSPLSSTASASKAVARPVELENPRKTRTLPASSSAASVASRKASTTSIVTSSSQRSPIRRERTLSSASRANSDAISAVSNHSRSARTTTATSTSSASRPSSSASRPASSLTSHTTQDSSPFRTRSRSNTIPRGSKTPSPDLPEVQNEPITPVPSHMQKKAAMNVLGLGTPEVDRWLEAGKEDRRKARGVSVNGKGKTVGFQDEEDSDEEEERERERTLSLQISPHRAGQGIRSSSSGSSDLWEAAAAISTSSSSPNSNSLGELSPGKGSGGAPAPSSAHELLKTIVQDVMYDFQRETKAEMMGLHLDMLRMGRGWKNELRTLMDEYVGDLRELREENQRLRAENERLRRGY
ncbi:hypothetical protein CVT26_006525 [Gymnopilus dilepis]|uniref:Anaphase-promoting complex subunit 4 WD40 domain-containing protein n=1 Tax=Gymnopilus dilepis TaxID=231916 RepID=A0A409Y3G2_9AGAR|nr:hypothetical protein CVT26_006525 [Gymnopilus dilepis]